jgi:hypothetical protein
MRPTGILMLALAATPCVAHHSTAEFDYGKTASVSGTVKEFLWTNPHSYIELLTTDASGKQTVWSIECGTPEINFRRGWTKTSLKPGDSVQMTIAPSRNNVSGGTLRVLTLADGRQLKGVAASAHLDANGKLIFQ